MDAFGSIILGRVLTVAVRRGLFELVAQGPRSVKEIAEATHLHARAVALMADSLCVAGYLRREGARYAASTEGKKWLVQSSPHYLGNLVRYFETLYARWERFDYALEHGAPERPYFDLFTEEDWRVYVYGMRDLAKLLLPHVESRLVLAGTPTSLLDLGGSHGLYALALCRRYPTLHALVADFAPALLHTRQIALAEAMADRVTTLEGDFRQMPFPSHLDAVLMFNIVHGFGEEENRELIARAYAALKTGGKLFVLDQMQSERRRSQLAALIPLMVGLNMLNEIGGMVYRVEEVERWCSSFSSVRHHRLRLPGVVLIEAVK